MTHKLISESTKWDKIERNIIILSFLFIFTMVIITIFKAYHLD